MMEQKTQNNWYRNLMSHCNSLAEKFGLDDLSSEELRSFVNQVARDQYKLGNKSGIRWAFKKKEEGSMQGAHA